ncbi:MAG: hypothetical protein HYU68_13320 [Bacteroidetes bacterium]|nr:hypothetical protein [Bacteroidota bacterium]
MQYIFKYSVIVILFGFFTSCNFFNKVEVEDDAVARVKDVFLFNSAICDIIPKGASKEDSLLIANNYIQNWIKERLVLEKAELNLKDDQRDFDKQIEEYRNTLLIYSYENQLINEILDTNVSADESAAYYQENFQIFVLKNDIVKVRYLKVPKNAPNLKKIQKLYTSKDSVEVKKLKELAHQYAEQFHFNDDEWILLNEIKKEIPNSSNFTGNFLKHNKSIVEEDSLSMYFIYFIDYKLEQDISPLSFEMDNIKSMIINKRKLKLLHQVKNDLYEQALNNKDFEIYDKQNKGNREN